MDNLLWNKALQYVSKRERCEKEVRDYLGKSIKKFTAGVSANELIDKLKSLGFLSDDRFAKAFIHDSLNLHRKGSQRIRFELKHRGIKEEIIDRYLPKKGDNEGKIAEEFAKRRYKFMENLPVLTAKRRLFGLLLRRGFEPSLVHQVVDTVVKKR